MKYCHGCKHLIKTRVTVLVRMFPIGNETVPKDLFIVTCKFGIIKEIKNLRSSIESIKKCKMREKSEESIKITAKNLLLGRTCKNCYEYCSNDDGKTCGEWSPKE